MKFGLSVVFGVLTLVAVIGFLVFIVVTIVAKIKKRSVKKYLLTAIGCFVAMIVFSIATATLYNGTDQQIEADAKKAQETVEKEKQQDKKEEQAKDKKIDEPIKKEEVAVDEYTDVFFFDLANEPKEYDGKSVRTVVQVEYCFGSGKDSQIRSKSTDFDLTGHNEYVEIYPKDYKNFNNDDYESGEFITVEGELSCKNNHPQILKAVIVKGGSETYESGLAEYRQAYNEKLQKEKEEFIGKCTTVSYEDLRRYPDSYRDTPIKLTIYIKTAKADGLIFQGDIIATYEGGEMGVYDDRIKREPRIMEGDTITVYAMGDGLCTMKKQQKVDVGVAYVNKTVDKYEVPSIKIKYTANDKDFVE